MANALGMMKKAATMQRQMKKMQKELAKRSVEVTSGSVTVVACGDMSIKKVSIDPEALKTKSQQQIEKMIASAVNSGLDSAKKMAGAEMSNMSGGLGGLSEMLGG